ncbi:MAG: histidine kinase dimerization/phosphoacceptor domain -containing protein [Bacteroidota bacterium]
MHENSVLPMIYRYFLLIFFSISFSALYGAEAVLADFEEVWRSDFPSSKKVRLIDSLAQNTYPFNNPLPFEQLHKALALANQIKDEAAIADIQLTLGAYYSNIDLQDSSDMYLQTALKSQIKLGNEAQIARSYKELSWLYLYIPDYDKALAYGYEALDRFEQLGNGLEAAIVKSRIGEIFETLGRFEDAYPLLLEAEEVLKESASYRSMGYNYLRLARYYWHKKDTLQTEIAYSAYVLAGEKRGRKSYLGSAYHRLGGFYQDIGDYEKAEQNFNKALVANKGSGYTLIDLMAKFKLGGLYVEQGRFEEAIAVLEQTIVETEELAKNEGGVLAVDFEEIYAEMAKAYEGMGAYEEAYTYLSRHKAVSDSLFTAEANRAIIEMQTKYETEKKETELAQKEQQLFYLLGFLAVLSLMGVALLRAYAGKRKQNQLLEKRNEEKEFLIKEIHHRVKNNLQVLSSLLSLQSDYIADPAALDAVLEGRNRVQSMGLIHQKLYSGEDLAAVEMRNYVEELAEHLLDSFYLGERVKISYEIEVPPMDVDTAIPLGLIINELLTNSMKYAFSDGRNGNLIINLFLNKEKHLVLEVADDGLGKKAIPKDGQSTSFGTDLIKILSKKLKGKIEISNGEGYQTRIVCQKFMLHP